MTQAESLRAALEWAEGASARALAGITRYHFRFTTDVSAPLDALDEAGRWEKLAFTLYTDLCEVSEIARAALRATPPADTAYDKGNDDQRHQPVDPKPRG